MRKLDPIIARFVNDVFALVKEATADGLRKLLAEEARRPRTYRLPEERVTEPRPVADRGHRASGPAREPARRSPIATADIGSPAPAAEITNPQWLLAMGMQPLADAVEAQGETEADPELESEGPASAVRELAGGSPVRLRANETLARVSGAGIVIRRSR